MQDLYGNQRILEEFSLRAEEGRLPHSLLILGDKGSGKKTLAKKLAYLYLKEEGGDRVEELLKAGNHPDFHRIQVGEGSLKKKDVLGFIEESQKTAYLSKNQVFLLDHVDELSPQGQNALLKNLEEPKKGVAIFLTGTNKEKILSTIRSRCRLVQVAPLKKEELYQALADRGYGQEETLDEAIRFSRGSLGRALDLLEDGEKIKLYRELFRGLEGFKRRSRDYPFVFSDFFLDHQDHLEDLVFQLFVYYRDLLLLRDRENSDLVYLPKRFQARNHDLKTSSIYTIIKAIQKSMNYFDQNGNKRLGIEHLLMQIQGEYL